MNDLARAWDEAAEGYEAYFVPRFAPWVRTAADALAPLPDGPILVPCCGTLPELDALTEHFPGREITGIDLSAGMVRLAQARAAGNPLVTAVEGDAATLDPRWTGRCAAVVSVFGLQQLPEPDVALAAWAAALRPGGRLSVVYWPGAIEMEGPFAVMREALRPRVTPSDRSWEDRLVPALSEVELERDEFVTHPMTHPDAETVFEAYTRSGPLRPLVTARGEQFAQELREEFLRLAPAGEWTHRPGARLLVARR
ncbi:class I SAM-dependent methyltransferase [Amycolatopsis magusensis]|uniref:class I SAM-dependent methyltransferase n=1 Tax=Amycolatopsis magusensis TaxID=882444 RepID=UPI0024A9B257|nr:class I SAM-dependent methyltransferase [Amycolatopsis magusensis]MDI5976537.1 methyltransferase domain-containing protein [Amycolatopsis magusensis]